MSYALIALNIRVFSTYTYAVSDKFVGLVQPGSYVDAIAVRLDVGK